MSAPDPLSIIRSVGFREGRVQGRAEGLEESARFLEEHARGYEESAIGVTNKDATERRTIGHILREKAHRLRRIAKEST